MKRFLDFLVALVFLLLLLPVFLPLLLLVWASDLHSPFFWTERVGQKGRLFWMLKIRTMVWKADQSCSITPTHDSRVTPLGRWLRLFKLDELLQFWNIVRGDMSLVGPRPDVYEGGVSLYTPEEREILNVKPGLVDLASLLFAQEGKLLASFSNPEEDYYQVIFPFKKQLMLFYAVHQSVWLDFQILYSMGLLLISRRKMLSSLEKILVTYQASPPFLRHYQKMVRLIGPG